MAEPFLDKDGNEIDVQTVAYGEDAMPPMWDALDGYIFTGWDRDYTNVYEDITVQATYVPASDVTGVSLDKSELTLEPGKTAKLTATVALGRDTDNSQLIWQSGDESVVTVDETGALRAIKNGTAAVYAVSEDSGMSAACVVTVEGADPCKNGHTPETLPGCSASCTLAGLTEGSRCAVCQTVLTEQQVIRPTGHRDADADGFCDDCGTSLESGSDEHASNCVCGEYHKGPFAAFLQFFHRIIYFLRLKDMFGKN